jgi:hypothetical protein
VSDLTVSAPILEETAAPEIAIAVPRSRAISFFIFSFSLRFVRVPRAKAAAASFLIRCVPTVAPLPMYSGVKMKKSALRPRLFAYWDASIFRAALTSG